MIFTTANDMNRQTLQDLVQQRDALKQRLDAINNDYRRGLEADFEEQAVQLANADVLNEIARVTAIELANIERQLILLQRAHESEED